MSLLVRMIVFGLGVVMMAKAVVMGMIEGILGIHSHDPCEDEGQANWLTSRADTTPTSLTANSPDQIERLATSRHVDANVIHELRSHRVKITPTLLGTLEDRKATIDAKIHAACLLIVLRETQGFQYVADCLHSKEPATVVQTMEALAILREDETEDHVTCFLEWPNMVNLLLEHVSADTPEVRSAAIQACGYLQVPGALDRFQDMLRRDAAIDRGRMAYWLGRDASALQAMEALERVGREADDCTDLYWIASGASRLAARADVHIQRRCVALARDLLAEIKPSDDRYVLARREMLGMIGQYAIQSDGTWIQGLISQVEPEEQFDLYTALIRIQSPNWRESVLQGLSHHETTAYAANALATAYSGPPDPQILQTLQQQLQSAESPAVVSVLCAALEVMGTDQAWQSIQQHHERAAPWDRMHWCWHLRGWQLSDLREDICAAFMLPTAAFEQACDAIKSTQEANQVAETDRPPVLLHLLHAANRLVEFPCEVDDSPCPHDELLVELAHITGGAWPISQVVQRVEFDTSDADAETFAGDEPYHLRFVTNGVEYRARLRSLGDDYDFARVIKLGNRVLEDLGGPGRFISLYSDGEYQCFVYGIPERVSELAVRYAIPLAEMA